jgi:hypothetical protein
MHKIATRSSTPELEKKIRELAKETGLSLSAIYRRAHELYIGNESRKRKVKGE